jgi:hypothetical protein
MRTSSNISVQCWALAITALLRLAHPGWTLVGFIWVYPLLALLTPLAVALVTERRGRLDWSVGAASLASAGFMVLAAAFVGDSDDRHDWVPLIALFAPQTRLDTHSMAALWRVGEFALIGYVFCVFWLLLVVGATRRPGPRTRRARQSGTNHEPGGS